LRGFGFGGGEVESVQFEKEDSDDEPGELICVDERMVFNYASGIGGGRFDYVGGRDLLAWTRLG
jgi:hypothetical protein